MLIEGYKREGHPKLEVRRLAARARTPMSPGDATIRAVAADHPVDGEAVPVLALDAASAIADLIERETGLAERRATRE